MLMIGVKINRHTADENLYLRVHLVFFYTLQNDVPNINRSAYQPVLQSILGR